MARCIFFLLIVSFVSEPIHAQVPHVLIETPVAQVVNASAEDGIDVMFDTPMDTSTIYNQTFRVFGKWSGPASGVFSFPGGNETVHFQPNENFFAGELVLVQLSKGIKSTTGESLPTPYAWTYWIDAAPGVFDQQLIDTIELRLLGEGLIQTYGAYAGDMNNDGYSDLVTVNETSDDLRILMNDGEGGYPSFFIYDTGTEGTPSPNEGADFNNDGEIDFVVTTAWSNEVRVLMGDGQGDFLSMEVYYTSNGVRGVVVGDFDGDGWDDMLTTNRLDGNITIFMNEGDGTFTQTGMDVPNEDETACSITDINNDGILDVFYASYESEKVGILLGDGAGNFTYSSSISVVGKPWAIASGDFNSDGNADVASANSSADQVAVLFGDGQGGLSAPEYYLPGDADFPLAIDVADVDGDDYLDFVTSNHNSGNFHVFENNGVGEFSIAATLPALEAGSCAILHDRDNDGDVDITGADEDDDVLLLFENSGISGNENLLEETNPHLSVSPNPASDKLIISCSVPSHAFKVISLHSLVGTEIETVILNAPSSEVFQYSFDLPAGIEPGVYFLRLKTGEKQLMSKVVIVQ